LAFHRQDAFHLFIACDDLVPAFCVIVSRRVMGFF
jgi:hypothetical protein